MNYFRTQLGMVFVLLTSHPAVKSEEAVRDLMRPENVGESRPLWWYDVWYKTGPIVFATVAQSDLEPEKDSSYYVSNLNKKTKYGSVKTSIKISEVIYMDDGVNRLNGNRFRNGADVNVLEVFEYHAKRKQWIPQVNITKSRDIIVCLERNGIVFDGSYTIKWVLDAKNKDLINKIIASRHKWDQVRLVKD